MGYKSKRLKALDHKFKMPKDRAMSAISGYRWALYEICTEYDMTPDNIELLTCMYDFDFFSANAIQKRFPISQGAAIRKVKALEKEGYLKMFMGEEEIEVTKQGQGHKFVDFQWLRPRYRLTIRAKRIVERFAELVAKHGNTIKDKSEKLDVTPQYRHKDSHTAYNDKFNNDPARVISPFKGAEGVDLYYEEEELVPKWEETVARRANQPKVLATKRAAKQ